MSSETVMEFKKQFDILSKGTDEYSTTVPFIAHYTDSELSQCHHFVDVGAGRGNLAKPLSNYFEQTTVIEPNTAYYEEVMEWAWQYRRNIKGINSTWEDAAIYDVDCVLMSHVLYYVEKEKWLPFVDKAYKSLNPGGGIIIILNRKENGVGHLYKQFLAPQVWQNIASAEDVMDALEHEGYRPRIRHFDSFIRADTADEIYQVMDFLLLGRVKFNTPYMHQKRISYARTHLQYDSLYAINSNYSIITINKPQ